VRLHKGPGRQLSYSHFRHNGDTSIAENNIDEVPGMFEATKVGRTLSKDDFKVQEEVLRADLLQVQQELLKSNMPVVVIVAGVEGAGKGEVVNRLNKWLDARGMQTFAFWDETDEERERPRYWRFWRSLPPRGQISLLFGGWYLSPIEHRFMELCNDAELDAELSRIVDFERMLTLDGALVVKFWFHLSEKDQKQRLKELSRDDRSKWKMHPEKKKFSAQYALFEQVAERVIRHTDRGISPMRRSLPTRPACPTATVPR
jgi:polyphosphate kinase 2 (PPK2 family)